MIILWGQRISEYRKWPCFPFVTPYFYFFMEIYLKAPNEKKYFSDLNERSEWEAQQVGFFLRGFKIISKKKQKQGGAEGKQGRFQYF